MEFETSLSSYAALDYSPKRHPARASIEHPDSGELHDPEKSAIAEMDAAINELESVVNDGRAPGDHPRLIPTSHWIAHFNEAAKLSGAQAMCGKKTTRLARGERAIQHIGRRQSSFSRPFRLSSSSSECHWGRAARPLAPVGSLARDSNQSAYFSSVIR